MHTATAQASAAEGIDIGLEGGACVAAARILRERDFIEPNHRVVVFNTGSAAKYLDGPRPDLPVIAAHDNVDYAALVNGQLH